MSFFDDSHVTDVGLQGSLGPSVGPLEMVQQDYRQQFRVDSARALDDELRNRWLNSLRVAGIADQEATDPFDPYAYRALAQRVSGQPITALDPNRPIFGDYDPTDRIKGMIAANEQIKKLNNPNIKTFEQILQEVSQMQHGVEEETASMSERTGLVGTVAGFIGSAAGSFTLRDPVNVITAPLGAGRTVAMHIATDMGIAGLTTAITDTMDVNPAREIVGLPQRSALYDVAAATIGAGLIRGGLIEPAGAALRGLKSTLPTIDFDLRDQQLAQMFAAHDTPTSRAGASILDDTIAVEHYNPYGPSPEGVARFKAELEAISRALNGEPELVRELPPVPSEYVERAISFQAVKEQAPELWNELETARIQFSDLTQRVDETAAREPSLSEAVRAVDPEAADKLDLLALVINDETLPEPVRVAADIDARAITLRVGHDKIMKAVDIIDNTNKHELRSLRASKKAANRRYRAAYTKVEAEAQRLELAEAAKQHVQQTAAIEAIGPNIVNEPITGPLTHRATVEAHEARVTEANASIPERADVINDLEVDLDSNTVNIGTKTPVSLDFKVPLDEGEKSVREILDELTEDNALEEAMKRCAI